MSNLQKVRGRVKAKDLKQGKIYYRSGIGGVECVRVESRPFRYKEGKISGSGLKGTHWVKVTTMDWVSKSLQKYSLGDMGISCLGDYKNASNRIFKTKKQADNWQVYLELSGIRTQHEVDMELYDVYMDYDYE